MTASTPFALTGTWTSVNRSVAEFNADMLLSNTAASDIRWARTESGSLPEITPREAHLLRPGRSQMVPVNTGGALWMAGSPRGRSVVDVFDRAAIASPRTADRDELVDEVSAGESGSEGEVLVVNGQLYRWAEGAAAIPDLPGLLPVSPVTAEHFGAVGDGIADDTEPFQAAVDYLGALGGGILQGLPFRTYLLNRIELANGVTIRGQSVGTTTLKVHPDLPPGDAWMTNADIDSGSTARIAHDIAIECCTLDGTALPFRRWLSTASGAPVTDPEADYVMGSGALASGISGVNLTATVSDGAVTGVTIHNGGSGWNGHPTHPYATSTVALRFEGGGGAGALAYATISGGTLSSVTIRDGGSGYTAAPSVTTMGGYADITLLTEPSVDRRNPAYDQICPGVHFRKVARPRIENVRFVNFKTRTLLDQGCLNGIYRNLEFTGCGKNDGPFHCIWVQSHGNYSNPSHASYFADSENTLIEDVLVENGERSAVAWGPTKGGTIRRLTARNCGESVIWVGNSLHGNGGRSVFDQLDLSDNYTTDIAGQLIEAGGTSNILITNSRFRGAAEDAIGLAGCSDIEILNSEFIDNGTAASAVPGRVPFGPFSERYAYNAGKRPIAGEANLSRHFALFKVGITGGVGTDRVRIAGCRFRDGRSAGNRPDHIIETFRAGGTNLAGSFIFEDNDLGGTAQTLYHDEVGSVWTEAMGLSIRNNRGHVSNAPVTLVKEIGSSGTIEIRPGFRPRHVRVEAIRTNNTDGVWRGWIDWSDDSPYFNAGGMGISADTKAITLVERDNRVVRLLKPNTDVIFEATFLAWREDGLALSADTVAHSTTLHITCFP